MSVPSFFSRLYEQAGAFSIVNRHNHGLYVDFNVETERLVSNCLDLIEFIFLHGSEINVTRINIGDINALSASKVSQLLLDVIREDLLYSSCDGIEDWYLFEWRGILLGGVSPMSLVYTSPNLVDNLKEEGLVLRGSCGNELFIDVIPLSQRGSSFKNFIYEYCLSYNLPDSLREYISHSIRIDNVPQNASYGIIQNCKAMHDNDGTPIYVNGIPLLYMSDVVGMMGSDYVLVPHKIVEGSLPLALTNCGLPEARYILDMRWIPCFCKIPPSHCGGSYLPAVEIKYPFVSVSDFLEEKLIKLPVEIDFHRFLTCSSGKSSYLLPIRSKFFEYFQITDLQELLSIKEIYNSIEIILQVPVRGGFIEFRRMYHEDDIIQLKLNIAITPFFDLGNEQYHMFCVKGKRLQIDVCHSENALLDMNVSYTKRCEWQAEEMETYTINGKWDYLTVRVHNPNTHMKYDAGLVVPIFEKVQLLPTDCVFSVDIGDMYTTISHKRKSGYMVNLISDEKNEDYLGILCKEDDVFKTLLSKYFLYTDNGKINFSFFRNILCSNYNKNCHSGRILENCNIPLSYYDYPREGRMDRFLYLTVKGFLGFSRNMDYLHLYCEEVLFIMKLKAIRLYGCTTFDLNVAVPSFLTPVERSVYEQLWIKIRRSSGTDVGCATNFITETSAIVNTCCQLLMPVNENFVNLHIDTNHTVITFCDKNLQIRSLYIGMGIEHLFRQANLVGGIDYSFVDHVVQSYFMDIYSPEMKSFIHLNNWSLFDVFEYFFAKNPKGIYLLRAESQTYLMKAETIFLVGLFYYIGCFLENRSLETPKTITFSGVGAKYIGTNLWISYGCDIEALFKDVISATRCAYERNTARVQFFDNPTQVISNGLMVNRVTIDETFDFYYGLYDNIPINWSNLQVKMLRDSLNDAFHRFVDVLNANCLFRNLNIKLDDISLLEDMGKCSADYCMNVMSETGNVCDEAIFFWTLKHSLYEWLKRMIGC